MDLLPAIDILDGKAVRLAKGNYHNQTVYNNDPADQAQRFEEAGARWIHVVDLNGARSGQPENIKIIERIMAKTLLKVEVGGGIRSLETIERLYQAGVSRVVLGTSLVANEQFAEQALSRYPELLAAGIDAKQGNVALAGWEQESGIAAEELIVHVGKLGFKHLIYTDISRDGMQTGIDAARYVEIAQVFGHPVIASGGVANIDDIKQLAQVAGCIEGVIAGRAVYEKTLDVGKALALCDEANEHLLAEKVRNKHCDGCDGC